MSRRGRIDISRFFDDFFAGVLDGRIESRISRKDIRELLYGVRRIFLSQPMFLRLEAPMVVCGDLHGQLNDVMRIFDAEGFPHMRNYLFLGDYVDRGQQSVELILFMFACKANIFIIRYPKNFFMLRGNHETSSVNRQYGFYKNVMNKYRSEALYELFQRVFDCMPLSALISDRILCMHGGLSPRLLEAKTLDVLDNISRPLPDSKISESGNQLAVDLLWADPDINVQLFSSNRRGIGRTFGQEVIDRVRQRFGIDLIIRAHQVVLDGHEFFNDSSSSGLVTLFSAPHYCGQYDNSGAIVRVDKDMGVSFKVFKPQLQNNASRRSKKTE
ncbi:Serine/threonine-protein phosphatase [Meloidogyne graminicola]|uniref:Serine/threonine-protein phosphatase n=1 Tax=Meloidogyne graminicola TaxID=189291 RepID=A0A8S9ZRY2_9BILA|nr:Serine/threonine-protein phosphatase [Meloidogyne graminicola]